MEDPISSECCGQSFCRKCIEPYVNKRSRCPCGLPAAPNTLRKDWQLIHVIAEIKNLEKMVNAVAEGRAIRPEVGGGTEVAALNRRTTRPSLIGDVCVEVETTKDSGPAKKNANPLSTKGETIIKDSDSDKKDTYPDKMSPEPLQSSEVVTLTPVDERNRRELKKAQMKKYGTTTMTNIPSTKSSTGLKVYEDNDPLDLLVNSSSKKSSDRLRCQSTSAYMRSTPRSGKRKIVHVLQMATNTASTPQVKRGAPCKSPSTKSKSPGGKYLDRKNGKGETLLHRLCIKGDLDGVKSLVEQNADINTKDHARWTPLHEVCSRGFTNLAEFLIASSADVNAAGGPDNNSTPLHDAAENGHYRIVKVLLENGADPTAVDIEGKTASDFAEDLPLKKLLEHAQMEHVGRPRKLKRISGTTGDVGEPGGGVLRKRALVVLSGLKSGQKSDIEQKLAKLGIKVAKSFTKHVTHVVTEVNQANLCKRTIKYLHGIACGVWHLSVDWVNESVRQKQHCSESAFEILGDTHGGRSGPEKSRRNTEVQNPGLFDGCQFFLAGSFDGKNVMSKKDIADIIESAGGQVIAREPVSNRSAFTKCPFHWPTHKRAPVSTFVISSDKRFKCKRRHGTGIIDLSFESLLAALANFELPIP